LAGAAKLPELVQRMEQIARTLAGLHAENKWHRDLKPENLFDIGGAAFVGDFGLVDYPDKEAVTASGELMGPLFYLAPEMMGDAADTPAGPADVYALAKTLWVLASGQTYPLQGEQRADSPGLRLSTYCPHPRATILDRLLERATRHDPNHRPVMAEFADELAAWLKEPEPAVLAVDLQALTREYQSLFETRNAGERKQQEFLEAAQGTLSAFRSALERVAFETAGVTGIPPSVKPAYDLPPRMHFSEHSMSPRVLWRGAEMVETVSGDDMHRARLQSFVQVEALSNEQIRILAGHLVRYEVGKSRSATNLVMPWAEEAIAAVGSAMLENEEQTLYRGLIGNVSKGIQAFAEYVRAIPSN
jgi:serine/threonine protein kinase